MLNKKYPIILITIMLCSYLAPLLDNESLEETNDVQETSSRSSACTGDVCISEVLVNAFGAETGAVDLVIGQVESGLNCTIQEQLQSTYPHGELKTTVAGH